MDILGQIANPRMANIAQAIDVRQQRVKEQQDALARVEMGRAIAKALPNLQEGSSFRWLAENDPEKFALVSKVLNIPLNDGDRFNQYANDVNQLYTLAQADPNQAYAHAQQLIESRKAQGQDTSTLEKWVAGMNEDPMKAVTSLFVMHRSLNPPKDDSMNEYQREKLKIEQQKLDRGIGDAAANQQFGAQETLKDSEGNLFFATTRRDPKTKEVVGVVAAVDGSNAKPVGKLSVTGSYGLTANEKVGQGAAETVAKGDAEDIVKYKRTLFDSINSNSRMLSKYNFAIKQLDNGAQTGPVIRSLPSLKEQSILVDVVRKEIGMELLGSGLLGVNPTDKDVQFALETAVPDNLRPDALKRELERRGSILQDINAAQEEYYRLIEDEGMTKGDILKLAKQRRDEKQAEERNGSTDDQSLDDLLSKYQ
jgi:hypothetical protein